jgi:hypothetical protein
MECGCIIVVVVVIVIGSRRSSNICIENVLNAVEKSEYPTNWNCRGPSNGN